MSTTCLGEQCRSIVQGDDRPACLSRLCRWTRASSDRPSGWSRPCLDLGRGTSRSFPRSCGRRMAGRTVPAILVGMDAIPVPRSASRSCRSASARRSRSTASTSSCRSARSSGCWERMVPARRRPPASWRPSSGPTRALDAPQPGELVPHPVELERGGGQEGNLLPLGERHAALLTEAEAGDDEPRDSLGDEDLDRLGVREGRVFAARPSA